MSVVDYEALGGRERRHVSTLTSRGVGVHSTTMVGTPDMDAVTTNTEKLEPAVHSLGTLGGSRRATCSALIRTLYAEIVPSFASSYVDPVMCLRTQDTRRSSKYRATAASCWSPRVPRASIESAIRACWTTVSRAVLADSAAAVADLSNASCSFLPLLVPRIMVRALTHKAPIAANASTRSVVIQLTSETLPTSTDTAGRS